MNTQNSDANTLIAALQSDLPSAEDDARMRARLAAAGVCFGASAVIGAAALTSASGSAASATVGVGVTKVASAVTGLHSGGLFSAVMGALPLTGGGGVKALVVASVIAAGASYPLIAPKITAVLNVNGNTDHPTQSVGPVALAPVGSVVARVNDQGSTTHVAQLQLPASNRIIAEPSLPQPSSALVKSGERPGIVAGRLRPKPESLAPGGVASETKADPGTVQQANAVQVANVVAVGETQTGVLAEETLLIEHALRAQRAGDTASARSWLGVHRQRFPDGKLTIERNRMWAQLQD